MAVCAWRVVPNHSALRTSLRRVPLKRSLYPFSHGDPGYMRMRLMLTLVSQSLNGSDQDLGPS